MVLGEDPEFLLKVQSLIKLHSRMPHTKRMTYPHGLDHNGDGLRDIEWLNCDGHRMQSELWRSESALTFFFPESRGSRPGGQDSTQNGLVAWSLVPHSMVCALYTN